MKAKKDNNILGHTYSVWRRLQYGQEKILRFAQSRKESKKKLRVQNGHEHCVSVSLLSTDTMIRLRPYVKLDELMLTRAFELHDKAEGLIGSEVLAPVKKDENDLEEYIDFEKVYKNLSTLVWKEAQRCFLLQFVLTNPKCFPTDARKVMSGLARSHYNEALFFQGVQHIDYLFYAYECFCDHGEKMVIKEVMKHSIAMLERVSDELPGFNKILWTPKIKNYFTKMVTND